MRTKFLLPVLCAAMFFSCHKSDRDDDKDTTTASEGAGAFIFEQGIFSQLHSFVDTLSGVNKVQTVSCATVTVSGSVFPKTVTVDFGSANCACADGNIRRGKIIAVFSGKYRDSLTTITVSTSNFYYNSYLVNLSKTIVNKGRKSNGNMWFAISSNASITTPAAKTISFTGNWKREWTGGDTTAGNFSDDTYSITGSGSGTGTHGNKFTASITSALTVSGSCAWITGGQLEVIPANLSARQINFGSGSCDNAADLTVNGHTESITLP